MAKDSGRAKNKITKETRKEYNTTRNRLDERKKFLVRHKFLTGIERTTLREIIDHFNEFKKKKVQHMKLDDLCLYKKLEQNPDSTTFIEVRDNRKNNPKLYRCISCNGYNKDCDNYEVFKRGK